MKTSLSAKVKPSILVVFDTEHAKPSIPKPSISFADEDVFRINNMPFSPEIGCASNYKIENQRLGKTETGIFRSNIFQ